MRQTPESSLTYRATSLYIALVGASALAVALCAWSLWRQFDWVVLVFLVGCLYAAWTFGVQWRSHVTLDDQGLSLHSPIQRLRIEFRQIDAVHESGRIARRLVVTYHPLQENGLLDLETLHATALPAVERQGELLATLQAQKSHPSSRQTP
ncbi:MAG: hypothetical protein WHS90_14445 [Caldilinea sp.]|jgi:hypothetical protein|uniref:hypothetical protein n=1 Tax=Caldilinea sp. TaxID=2293560 RepID=UPI0030B77886